MNIWNFILSKHTSGIPVILLYVLQSQGSSPGRQGFSMAVSGDKDFFGSIGGGIMEHKFVEMAKAKLEKDKSEAEVYKQIHNKEGKDQSGMICSGEQTIFLYKVEVADIPHIRSITDSLEDNKNGTLNLSARGITFSDDIPNNDFSFTKSDEDFLYTEKTGKKNILHIIGGGHCSLAFSKLMSDLDFRISVYDERNELSTMIENGYAHKKNVVKSYSDISDMINGGDNVYVVIMTFGYRSDDIAIRALIDKNFRYIGILGSKKKMEQLLTSYRNEMIGEERLKKLQAPIGIPINSRTPEEIAISIAAEIVSVKNGIEQQTIDHGP